MIKALVVTIIVGVAGVIGWFWLQPECPGGAVVADEAACIAVPGFDRAYCASAFAGANEAIKRSGNIFQTRDDCLKRHSTCIDVGTAYSPKPAGFCLVRAAEGRRADMTPVYRGF